MSPRAQIRLASLTSAAYGTLLASGLLRQIQRTGSLRAVANSLSRPAPWVALLLAAVVTYGLWKRYAWAWWVAIAAAAYEIFLIRSTWLQRGPSHVPGASTLITLALMVLLLVLLLPRRSRLGCNR